MYKVFVNNFPLFILGDNENLSTMEQFEFLSCDSKEDAENLLAKYYSGSVELPVVIKNSHPAETFKMLFGSYTRIEAAGGVVKNKDNKILFIFRNGKWDLPKGKLDAGEERSKAALREVEEECGISGHTIISELSSTLHVYSYREKMAIKVTYWYLMRYPGSERPVPQEEEGITQVEWKNENEINEVFENTFESVKDVLREAMDKK